MAGLDPAIHALVTKKDVDALDKRGHDGDFRGRALSIHSPSTALVMMLRWISLEPP